jgi:hypothetical protein
MHQLARYEAVRRALEEALTVDEVKDIRDKALALEAYARQANDEQLLRHANELRMRTERLTGALLDRLTHHVHILEMNGESFRLAASKKAQRRSAHERGQIPKPPIEGELATKNEST